MTARNTPRGNRRLTSRRACLLIVRYQRDGAAHPATAMDLSPKGCRLRIGEDIPRGTGIDVSFETPVHDGSVAFNVDVPAEVIWVRVEGLSRQVGVRFRDVPTALFELLGALG